MTQLMQGPCICGREGNGRRVTSHIRWEPKTGQSNQMKVAEGKGS